MSLLNADEINDFVLRKIYNFMEIMLLVRIEGSWRRNLVDDEKVKLKIIGAIRKSSSITSTK